jgi:NADH-quinone oxidoreductase subunit E
VSGLVARLIPEFEQWKKRYPAGFEGSLSLPCLRRIQEERGYITDDDITDLTAYLGVPRIRWMNRRVLRIHPQPLGTPHPGGAQRLVFTARRRRLVASMHAPWHQAGETTSDGKFTLTTVECLASCGTAPMMMVGNTYHENLTPASVDALLEDLAK